MRTMLKLTFAALLMAGVAAPVHALDNTKKITQSGKLKNATTGGTVTTGTGNTVSELSAQDCRNVGGKVITVTDDRCGASGKYCRMPDTNAVCIDVLGN